MVNPGLLDIELGPEAVLTGSVTSPEGDPVSHLAIFAEWTFFQDGLRQTSFVVSTVTHAHGGFRMPVPAGVHSLHTQYARPDDMRSLAVLPTQRPIHAANEVADTIHIASGEELHFDLHPVLAAAFRITIPLEGSRSQRYPSVTLTTSEGVTFPPSQRVTPEGIILTLPAGSYNLLAGCASPEGQLVGHQALTVPEQDSTSGPLHLEAVPVIPITITIDPASVPTVDGSLAIAPSAAALNLQLEPDSVSAVDSNSQVIRSIGRGAGSFFLAPTGTYHLLGGESSFGVSSRRPMAEWICCGIALWWVPDQVLS